MDEANLQEILDDAAERLALGRYSNADAAVHSLVAEVRRLTAALDAARREGAEGMRERCAALASPARWGGVEFDGYDRGDVVDDLRDAIRALPLDAPGGGS